MSADDVCMDSSIWADVVGAAGARPELTVLPEREAAAFALLFEDRFLKRRSTWWWDSVREPAEIVEYGASDGLGALSRTLGRVDHALLLVTDEQAEPCGTLRGPVEALVGLLADLPFFEYAVVDPRLRWAVFDNHHNQLILAGVLPGHA